jgi:hypothetical protein
LALPQSGGANQSTALEMRKNSTSKPNRIIAHSTHVVDFEQVTTLRLFRGFHPKMDDFPAFPLINALFPQR